MVKLVIKKPAVKAEEIDPKELGPTERRWMAHKQKDQMFVTLTTMAEENNRAFDILMEFFTLYADAGFHKAAIGLDDMNIRGEQIVIAYDFLAGRDNVDPAATIALLWDIACNPQHDKRRDMINHINRTWKKGFMEAAVMRGAHQHMHKKIVTPPNVG